MKNSNRRKFLKVTAGGMTGLAVSSVVAQIGVASPRKNKTSLQHTFFVEPGAISLYDRKTQKLTNTTAWGIPAKFSSFLPSILSEFKFDLESVESWAKEKASGNLSVPLTSSSEALDVILSTPLIGSPDVSEIVAESTASLIQNQNLDLSLEFLYFSGFDYSQRFSFSNGTGLPLVEINDASQLEATLSRQLGADFSIATNPPPPSVTLYGWKFQFRGPETHTLGSCVRTPVNHFHIDLFHQNRAGGWDYVVRLHIGTYRNSQGRRCFVLWNSEGPAVLRVCWPICSPNRSDLEGMLRWMIVGAASLLGVSIAGWIVSAIATAGSVVLYPALLLL